MSLRVTRSMPPVRPPVFGNSALRSVTIWPVGVWVVDTAMVRLGLHLSRFFGSVGVEDVEAQIRGRHGRRRSCSPPERGRWVILMSEITAPPFCARPVWSRPITCLPSRARGVGQRRHHGHRTGAADAHHVDADPMAVVDLVGRLGQLTLERRDATLLFLLRRPVASRGRFGSCQERRAEALHAGEILALHELWWMRVLRPNSVCTGSTLMQLTSRRSRRSPRRRAR